MAGGSDVREILQLGDSEEHGFITKDALFNSTDSSKKVCCNISIDFHKFYRRAVKFHFSNLLKSIYIYKLH